MDRWPREAEEALSFLGLANLLLRHRRLVGALALLGLVLLPAITLIFPRTYTSASVFMPQTRSAASSLSGLAAQLGFTLPSTESGQNPSFYADLLESNSILGLVVDSRFEYRTSEGPVQGDAGGDLSLGGREPGASPRRGHSSSWWGRRSPRRRRRPGWSSWRSRLGTRARAAINHRLIDLVNEFNLRTRQSQAANEREFTERRLGRSGSELRTTEDQLQSFLQRNRDYTNSPALTFQVERLQREVSMRQEVFTTLAQALEQAKIEEVRDTPVITVVQRPELPVRPDPGGSW